MLTRRGRTRTGLLVPLGLALVLTGCGQAGTSTGSATDAAGPTTEAAPTPPETTEDGMAPEDGSERTTDPTEPELLVPTSAPIGAAELPGDPSGAELTLVVGGPGGPQPPVTLSCDWTTGTSTGSHPQAEQACADLLTAVTAGNPFAPVPADTICTQQYGGDATAEVTGAVLDAEGGPVDVAATFALTDGCQIDRWQQLGAVLGPYGGAT